MNTAIMAEFGRLYKEASEVAYSHEEFLGLIFNAAVKLASGEWGVPACDCQQPDERNGVAGISEACPVHNDLTAREKEAQLYQAGYIAAEK